MPYRITMTVDIPDADKGPTTETARRTYDALSDMQEAAARYDGDFQHDDVEWYGFEPGGDELTTNSWTYADEETIRSAMGWSDDVDPEHRLRDNAESEDQLDRLIVEYRKRTAESDLAAHVRYLDRLQESLPVHDAELASIILYLRGQLRK